MRSPLYATVVHSGRTVRVTRITGPVALVRDVLTRERDARGALGETYQIPLHRLTSWASRA